MTTLTISVLWCVLQVTLVGLLTAGLYLVVRRFSPASSAGVLLSGMVVAALLAVTAASPWPSWARGSSASQTTSPAESIAADDDVATPLEADAQARTKAPSTTPEEKPDNERPATTVTEPQPAATEPQSAVTPGTAYFDQLLSGFDAMLLEAGRDVPSRTVLDEPVASTRVSWPMIAGAVFGLAAIIGVLRFAIGWFAVRRQVARSRVLNVAALDQLCQTLCRDLGCRRPVALRESAELATAATVGWRRPVILLPRAWSTWTDDECRAVLAHELAHVARGHFAAWLLAQTGLVLHFYHPLIHWLASRLRLEQEYEADALAARVTGGPQPYLQTLARLALHQSDTPISWPARAFLPTRRTFLRRIDMLRQARQPWKPSLLPRALAVAVILCGGVFAAGLREPSHELRPEIELAQVDPDLVAESGVADQARSKGSAPGESAPPDVDALPQLSDEETAHADGPIELSYIPGDAVFVMAYRPLKLRNAIQVSDRLAPLSNAIYRFPVPWLSEFVEKSVVQFSLVGTPDDWLSIAMGDGHAAKLTARYRTLPSAPFDLSKLKDAREGHLGRTRYYLEPRGNGWLVPDKDTFVTIDSEDQLLRLIANGPQIRSEMVKSSDWQAAAKEAHLALAINLEMLGRLLPVDLSPYLALLTPLWESGDNAVVSARIENERIDVRLVVNCHDEDGTQAVRETLVAFKTLYGNILSGFAKQADRVRTDPTEAALIGAVINAPRELITAAEIESTGKQVVMTASHEIDAELVELLLKMIENAQQVAQRQSDRNDLKQFGLALHNYHDVYLHFPPAVVIDKESGVPRSWRVEVLPYLGEMDLYTQYRKDEPWDSEHNKQILAQMPDMFRSRGMAADSTDTRYLAPVGQGTAFDPAGPVRIRDITDGTSNTLMVVQSPTKTVPWTKPDDLRVNLEVLREGGRGDDLLGDEFGFGEDAAGLAAVRGSVHLKDAPKQLDLGGLDESGFLAVFCDGSVGALKKGIAPTVLRHLLCRADGHVLGPPSDYLDKREIDRISREQSRRSRSTFGDAAGGIAEPSDR